VIVVQLLTDGLALGSAYTLMALGFTLILIAVRAANFAHGTVVVAGALAGAALAGAIPAAPTAILGQVVAVAAVLGVVLCVVSYLPIADRPPAVFLVSSLAAGNFLARGAELDFGATLTFAQPLLGPGAVPIGAIALPRQSFAIISAALLLTVLLQLLLRHTQFGRRLRAVSDDPAMASALGIGVPMMLAIVFAIASALAGAAGYMLANQFLLTGADAVDFLLKAYLAAALGRWNSLLGAAIGAFAIALVEVFVAAYSSAAIADAALYLALFAILLLRPKLLFSGTAIRGT
jgi:branched-chain amino acid transport system permease protein